MSLNQIYNKDKEAGLKISKGFSVPVSQLHVEPGFNIRQTDAGHINAIFDALKAERPVPNLRVKVVAGRIIIVDGHHTFRAAMASGITHLICEDVSHLSYCQQIALMVTSTQGRKLKPLERGEAYSRMRNEGMHPKEIAIEVGCSLSTVELHLLLMDGDETIKRLLGEEKINFADAVEMIRKHGHEAGEIVQAKVEENGGVKVKTRDVRPQYPAKKARRLVELATQIELVGAQDIDSAEDDQSMTLRCPAGVYKEVLALLNDYSGVKDDN